MYGINKVFLAGTVLDVLKKSSGTIKKCVIIIKTMETSYNKRQEKIKIDKSHSVICFGKIADAVEKFVNRGSTVFVDAMLDYEQSTIVDEQKVRVVARSLQFLDSKKDNTSKTYGKNGNLINKSDAKDYLKYDIDDTSY